MATRAMTMPGHGIRVFTVCRVMPFIPSKSRTVRRSSPASLQAIAEAAGVSAMTVSRVLNGQGNVSARTRTRVEAAAKRLKYRPNKLVKAMLAGRSGTVGVMISPLKSFQSRMLHGAHDALLERGCLPLLHFHDVGPGAYRDAAEIDYIHRLLDQRVDGLIFWPSDESVPNTYLKEVWERGVPLVAVDRHLPQTNADFSGTDDRGGGRIAAEHLLGLGHRRLAHVGGESGVSTYEDRRRGFEEAAAECRVAVTAVECRECDSYGDAMRLLGSAKRPTAIFAASDLMAPGIYRAAADCGLTVGRDLAVVGFADLSEVQSLVPGLTTLRQDPYRIGLQSVRLLMDRIDGVASAASPKSVRLVPELVVRGSSCPPP